MRLVHGNSGKDCDEFQDRKKEGESQPDSYCCAAITDGMQFFISDSTSGGAAE